MFASEVNSVKVNITAYPQTDKSSSRRTKELRVKTFSIVHKCTIMCHNRKGLHTMHSVLNKISIALDIKIQSVRTAKIIWIWNRYTFIFTIHQPSKLPYIKTKRPSVNLKREKYKMRLTFPPCWIYDSTLTKWELFTLNTTGTLKPSEVSYCRHKASRLHTPPFCTFSPCVIDVCFYKMYRVLFVSRWTDGHV